ncbi:hypothetical protein [Deinococcus aquiradiocola]|uniref:Uncharacterized protein n=1 Tax=Deinococcus aquiradiocola TaxID=393059 RepID=A0A917P4I0_9DEIO|nr:hypothetical protein [Deinococcus aquiradiocola]GGJ61216.1 hypothetical protein GCM10008939_01180 [Deinococcus aquiradiocola]
MTVPGSPLESLLSYYEPLCTLRRDFRGAATLHTPGSPLLGANASYLLPGTPQEVTPLLRVWHEAHGAPPLVVVEGAAWGGAVPGEPVESWRVGVYRPQPEPGVIVVEQTSRLHLSRFAGVLAESHDLPEWAAPLARSLAGPLERLPDAVLLLAYAGGEAIGALLWQAGAAHLWGTLDPAADAPLLNAAAWLADGHVVTSLPDDSPLTLEGTREVTFALLSGTSSGTVGA